MEPPFDKTEGVVSTTSGYTGGHKAGATYKEVSGEDTGHKEAVRVVYDPQKVSYAKLLDVFWHNVDPVDAGGQFCDRGEPYKTPSLSADDEQRRLADESKAALEQSGQFASITVPIEPASVFWGAEGLPPRLLFEEPDQVQNFIAGNAGATHASMRLGRCPNELNCRCAVAIKLRSQGRYPWLPTTSAAAAHRRQNSALISRSALQRTSRSEAR
jgi:peptide-methionine (S)-S-oxide reductase